MYNNLNILSYPVNRTQLLIHLTLWTFSVGSKIGEGFGEWSEAPSYEEGVVCNIEQQNIDLQNVYTLS